MIIWLDPDGRYVFVNPGATALLGYSAEELSTLLVVDVDPMFDEHRWREHWQDIVERKSFTIETVNTTSRRAGTHRGDGQLRRTPRCTVQLLDRARYLRAKAIRTQLLELNQKITRLSNTDELTGIANRRRANAALAERITAHIVSGDPLSVIMIDVDHFKAFNDHYGHAAGDDCLCRVAHAVDGGVVTEVGGLAARYGGEEFLCQLRPPMRRPAHAVAVRIQQSVADLAIPHAAVGFARCGDAQHRRADRPGPLRRGVHPGRRSTSTSTLPGQAAGA